MACRVASAVGAFSVPAVVLDGTGAMGRLAMSSTAEDTRTDTRTTAAKKGRRNGSRYVTDTATSSRHYLE